MAIIKTVEGKTPHWGKNCFIAENATLTGDCVLGDDCSIWYSAVLRSDVDAIRCGNFIRILQCNIHFLQEFMRSHDRNIRERKILNVSRHDTISKKCLS